MSPDQQMAELERRLAADPYDPEIRELTRRMRQRLRQPLEVLERLRAEKIIRRDALADSAIQAGNRLVDAGVPLEEVLIRTIRILVQDRAGRSRGQRSITDRGRLDQFNTPPSSPPSMSTSPSVRMNQRDAGLRKLSTLREAADKEPDDRIILLEQGICEWCDSKDGQVIIDPLVLEVDGDEQPIVLCPSCEEARRNQI